MDDYDDVPKTGESKADIWILWSVLFISILGAGFMIWKRFGLVRAIAEAEHQEAVIQREEQVRAEKKAKEDKLNMLKDLRNL
jgi:LPXTG-motif cell wall-anchored protein